MQVEYFIFFIYKNLKINKIQKNRAISSWLDSS